jgi:outer membrane protein assembly factor BamA
MRYVLLSLLIFSCAHSWAESPQEAQVFNLESLSPYDGRPIHAIRLHGLKWTKEQAVRWLLSQHEGDSFDAQRWLLGLHKIYDTTVLYNIVTGIRPNADNSIDIDLEMVDRWTLLPFGIAQAGGGSNQVGFGVADVNFLGYFAQLAASYSEFNHLAAYDLNYYQEFFRDTDYILGLDISQNGVPVYLQANNGQSLGNFAWQRNQEQLLVGEKFAGPLRLLTFVEFFDDQMTTNQGAPEVHVYTIGQYRLRPILIFGRSELTNFLEQGHEFTIAPTTANFLDSHHQYSQAVMTYKRVYLHNNTNYAYFINGGAMTPAPIPYLFHLGGFDTVRGFSGMRAVGRYYVANNLEYRPYLTRIHPPLIGEVVVQGDVFQDFGMMWNSSDLSQGRRVNSELTLLSEGVGIRLNFMRFAGAVGRLDVARTITPNEGWGVSLGVGQFF